MIILNEKEYAINCINEKQIPDNPYQSLMIMAKYYYHSCGYRKKKIASILKNFMQENFLPYKNCSEQWDDYIEKISKNAGKYTLYEIDEIWVTQSEIDTICNIHSKALERLAFTYLCLAKLGNKKNLTNNGWVTLPSKEIFALARISSGIYDRNVKIGMLKNIGMLEFPKKNGNLNCRVTFIDDNSEKIIRINDFRELGYEYRNYKGENFIRCAECGILTRGNKNGTKRYCNNCVAYSPMQTKTVECIDCGEKIEVHSKNNRPHRCQICQMEYIKSYDRLRKSNKNSV